MTPAGTSTLCPALLIANEFSAISAEATPVLNSITRFENSRGDEVDLVALGKSVWRQKRIIASAGLICASLACVYAFTATKQYEVASVLRPVAMKELDALNRSGVYKLSPKGALMRVAASLDSYETRLNFYRNNPEFFKQLRLDGRSDEQVFDDFNRGSLKLDLPNSKTLTANTYIGLKLAYPDGVDGVRLLNGLVTYAVESEREQVAADINAIVENRVKELNGKLDIARETYDNEKKTRIAKLLEADELRRANLQDELKGLRLQLRAQRDARIDQLNEAINIAQGLGITRPTTPSALRQDEAVTQGSVVRTEINNQQIPLYFMGTEALLAERQALRQRTSDDFTTQRVAVIAKELQLLKVNRQVEVLQSRENEEFFLKNVEGYRAELVRLHHLALDLDQLKLVSVDRQAHEPLAPLKPRKALIILLGCVVGVLLGIIFAVLRYVAISHQSSAKHQYAKPLVASRHEAIDAP